MKIGIISDLHSDLYIKKDIDLIAEMSSYFRENKGIDILLIAGDITENVDSTIKFVNDLKESIGIDTYYVPGNHDIWQNNGVELSTEAILKKYTNDKNCLSGKVINLREDLVLIGDIGWYDYSLGDTNKFSFEEFSKGVFGERTWQDKIKVKFNKSDKEKHKEILEDLTVKFEENKDKKIIFMTHMINHNSFKVDTKNREEWGFFNAFLGSEDYYTLVKKYKPIISISGHVHYRKSFIEDETTFICSCLGYHKEFEKYRGEMTLYQNIVDLLKIVEV